MRLPNAILSSLILLVAIQSQAATVSGVQVVSATPVVSSPQVVSREEKMELNFACMSYREVLSRDYSELSLLSSRVRYAELNIQRLNSSLSSQGKAYLSSVEALAALNKKISDLSIEKENAQKKIDALRKVYPLSKDDYVALNSLMQRIFVINADLPYLLMQVKPLQQKVISHHSALGSLDLDILKARRIAISTHALLAAKQSRIQKEIERLNSLVPKVCARVLIK